MKGLSYRSNVDKAIRHYSSLFSLPSYKQVFALLYGENLFLGLSSNMPFSPSLTWFINGILLGNLFFAITLLSDFLMIKTVLKKDVILNFRRLMFLSFSSNLLFAIFTVGANILTSQFSMNIELPIKVISLGYFAALSLRFIVAYSISFTNLIFKFLSGFLQPSLLMTSIVIIQTRNLNICYVSYYILLPLAFSILSVWLFINLLNKNGMETFGIPSLRLFKAFLADWTENFEQPFEEILEQIGEESDVNISLLIFRSKSNKKPIAIIVVPNIHPGPFKNIGSSPLPGLIANSLEKELQCVVSVPHGISGHELDLASQKENKRVLEELVKSLKKPQKFSDKATRFFIVEKNRAKAGCQVFDGCAFLTLTAAPEPMEDLPLELNNFVIQESMKLGFSWVIAVDAHNSINGSLNMNRIIPSIREAAALALKKARELKYAQSVIKVGASKIVPRDLGPKDGMGPGGITAVVVEVENQKTAYITIDGNNMVSGLREKILADIKKLGVDGGEVFTTDTHVVNAIVLTERGYHPIGEISDHNKIIKYVRRAVSHALKKMDLAEIAWSKVSIRGVKVIGEKQINDLSLLTDKVSSKAKKNSVIFPFFAFILIILFCAF